MSKASSTQLASLVAALVVFVAVGFLSFYWWQGATSQPAPSVVVPQYATQVLENGFGRGGLFEKAELFIKPNASTTVTEPVQVGSGEIGKTDLSSFE